MAFFCLGHQLLQLDQPSTSIVFGASGLFWWHQILAFLFRTSPDFEPAFQGQLLWPLGDDKVPRGHRRLVGSGTLVLLYGKVVAVEPPVVAIGVVAIQVAGFPVGRGTCGIKLSGHGGAPKRNHRTVKFAGRKGAF